MAHLEQGWDGDLHALRGRGYGTAGGDLQGVLACWRIVSKAVWSWAISQLPSTLMR